MKKYLRYLGPVLITALFVLAIYLLYHKLKAYSIAQIRESIQQVSTGSICFSIGLMIVNYIILVGYDWLALKAIHKSLPLPRVGLVSLVGQAVSYNFGALLGGTSVRYRFYSAWGFSLAEIVRLVLMLAVTFWVGALGLCGVVFLLAPPVIPDELLAKMPIHDVRFLGGILLAIALSYLVLCFTIRKPVHVFGKEFVFPVPRIAVAQMVVAGVDLIAAAACMAVLLFRLIYFILPLLAAAALLAVYEARQSRNTLREAGRWLSVLSHSIAAYTTFVGGCILLVSAMLPTLPAVVAQLDFLPRPLLMGGHLVCALSGALLLFVAYGLERRQNRAFWMAVILLLLGIAGALLKGLSFLAAGAALVVLITVWLSRRRFYRSSFFWEEAIPAHWLVLAFAALGLAMGLGWFIYHPAWDRAALWGFEQHFNASRVLLADVGIAVVVLASWIVRVSLRARKRLQERNLQSGRAPRA